MKIAFDVRPGNSGPARYVAALVREMKTPEWEVHYIDQQRQADIDSPSVHTDNGVPDHGWLSGAANSVRQFAPCFAKLWLGFHRDARDQAGQIRSLQPELVHAQHTGCEQMPVAARMARSPSVLGTFHVDSTYDLEKLRSGFSHRSLEWYSNRSLDLAIAVSEATKRDWVARSRIPGDRVITIHNGIDPCAFQRRHTRQAARHILGLPEDGLLVGAVGRLDTAKGFQFLLDAFAIVVRQRPDTRLAIAGTGPLRDQLEAQSEKCGLSNRVHFLGFQQNINLVLDAFDIFVLSSLCEALPFALLEAMAHELPVVGTTVGGVPEVIMPGETGCLVPSRNAAALAHEILELSASSSLRSRLGAAAKERVVRHFHVDEMVQKTLAVYRQMLGGNTANGEV